MQRRASAELPPDGLPVAPWTRRPEHVLESLGVVAARGLSAAEVRERLARYGPNRLREAARRSLASILVAQLASWIVALLAGAAALAFAFGDPLDAAAIVVVIVLNTAIGFGMELRAVRSVEALRELGRAETVVRRDGHRRRLPAEELVPGDLVVLEAGDVVAADLRLVEASKLQADESTLTGESVPVDKGDAVLPEDAPLPERSNMVFRGTTLTRGSGLGVVVATGMATELGGISSLVESASPGSTPLERRLDALGRRLIAVTLVLAALVAAGGLLVGRDALLVVEISIALAVATVPEGLPIVATLALASGTWRMARRNALVERLAAVEALGSTQVILVDKTGTLTENRMTLVELVLDDGSARAEGRGLETDAGFTRDGAPLDPGAEPVLLEALRVAALCNNASFRPREGENEAHALGDPTEVALLVAAAKAGLRADALRRALPELREVAFDPDLKMMATFHRGERDVLVEVKGAPEAVLAACSRLRTREGTRPLDDEARARWGRLADALARSGHRLIAFATRTAPDAGVEPYADLVWLGVGALLDPPRAGVREAIARCASAGLRVVMVTGDHAATARTVAERLGLIGPGDVVVDGRDLARGGALDAAGADRLLAARIVARATPQQKLDLLALYQSRGSVVAMTGDGVNDAPALRKADVGVAMGRRGTQAAREAADIVLLDDEFSTIVSAVEEGRAIFGNVRRFVVYLLSCNVSEILVVGLAALADAPLPLLPLQILFLNLVTDVFPALALGVGPAEGGLMERRPRASGEAVLTARHWRAVAAYGAILTAAVLGALALAIGVLDLHGRGAVTVSFLTLALAQLAHVFNMRGRDAGWTRNEITRNPWMWAALAACVALLGAALFVPGLARVLQLEVPDARGWAVVLSLSAAPVLLGPPVRRLLR